MGDAAMLPELLSQIPADQEIASVTAEVAQRQKCTASICWVGTSWRFGIGFEPAAARCLTLDRQVARSPSSRSVIPC